MIASIEGRALANQGAQRTLRPRPCRQRALVLSKQQRRRNDFRCRAFKIGYGRFAHAGPCATYFSVSLSAAVLTTSAFAQPGGTKVGVLTCQTSASLGLIVGSHQSFGAAFRPMAVGRRKITPAPSAASVSMSASEAAASWSGPWSRRRTATITARLPAIMPAPAADASLGLGAGAKVLVGGSHRSIALQPLSVSGQVGVNLALGVAGLTLRSVPYDREGDDRSRA